MSGTKRKTTSETKHSYDSPKRRKHETPTAVKDSSSAAPSENGPSDSNDPKSSNVVSEIYDTKSSKEAHIKQRAIARERKAAKPNADSISRAKKLWERLRLKSHVSLEERKKLVEELFSIITGHINDFVFKHDSVRPVQCALKYANATQRRAIAEELRGEYKTLAQSKYAKFLVAKILAEPDTVVRGWVLGEFEGSVKRLINHPEASWILDDSYRAVASPSQKKRLLREWYGAEFAIFKSEKQQQTKDEDEQLDLQQILEKYPEKRKPILSHLLQMINQLIQKKMTAFTMLHDAMLQYFLAVGHPASSPAAAEFIDLLKPTSANTDEQDYEAEKDILLNLAFTPSGSRLVARVIAVTTAKDRKLILRAFKDHIETIACDQNAYIVLLAAFQAIDDTVMTSKLIFPDLLAAKTTALPDRCDAIVALANHPYGRIPLLWPLATSSTPLPSSLIAPGSTAQKTIKEIRDLRPETSKKDPQKRRQELASALSEHDGILLKTITLRADHLVASSAGCQFITEVLLNASGVHADAVAAVAALARGDPAAETHVAKSPAAGRMLRTLILGGHYNAKEGRVVATKRDLGFAAAFWEAVKGDVVGWAVGESSFAVVNLLEVEGGFTRKEEVRVALERARKEVDRAAQAGNRGAVRLLSFL